jgi:hypothetical protein
VTCGARCLPALPESRRLTALPSLVDSRGGRLHADRAEAAIASAPPPLRASAPVVIGTAPSQRFQQYAGWENHPPVTERRAALRLHALCQLGHSSTGNVSTQRRGASLALPSKCLASPCASGTAPTTFGRPSPTRSLPSPRPVNQSRCALRTGAQDIRGPDTNGAPPPKPPTNQRRVISTQ